MPGVTVHFTLARTTLQDWRRRGCAPFDPDDPSALNAYFHGAVGPDLGYFPGGSRELSDLAHCLRTGRLSRSLLRTASTPRERAYAWGWVTHVLADQAIHPWIGRGVGALVHGDRECFVDGSSDLLSHLRVEMGVDAWYAARHPEARRQRLRPVFGPRELGFLVRAFVATYGVAFEPELFERSHRATVTRVGQALATIPLVYGLMGDGFLLPRLGWTLRALYRTGALRHISLAYVTPVTPERWLLEAVSREAERHTERMREALESDGDSLQDWNLDTGRLLESQESHPGTRRAMDALSARARPLERPVRGRTTRLGAAPPAPLQAEA